MIDQAAAAATRDFSWPEFDRWQAVFAAAGRFPPRWEGLQRVPAAHTPEAEAYRFRKLVLFYEWLILLEQRSIVRAHYARRRIRVRVARQDARVPCPACDPLTGREVGPGLDELPPFHPGCRCVLVAVHAMPAGRPARSYERPRSRTG